MHAKSFRSQLRDTSRTKWRTFRIPNTPSSRGSSHSTPGNISSAVASAESLLGVTPSITKRIESVECFLGSKSSIALLRQRLDKFFELLVPARLFCQGPHFENHRDCVWFAALPVAARPGDGCHCGFR